MRRALAAGLVILSLPLAARAQSGPFHAVVGDAEATLFAWPGDKAPVTARLKPGSPIVVDHEEGNGWLAVADPPGRPYSLSWVQIQFVEGFDKTRPLPQAVTVSEDVTLAAGEIGQAQPLPVRRAKVPAGTGLLVIGQKIEFEGKSWYPVVPPAGDFRYLPKHAVKYERPAAAVVVRDASPPPSAPVASLPPAGGGAGERPAAPPPEPATTAGKPAVQHPLWTQGEAAERDGRFDDAERAYFQLAQVMNQPGGDHDVANLCYTRIHTLREKKRAATVYPAATPPRPAPAGTPAAVGTPARSGSLPPEPRDDGYRWTGPGKLVRSRVAPEGRRTYVLESPRGDTLFYVVAGPGLDLEKYVGSRVDLYGKGGSYRDLSKPYLTASRVELVQ